jgi:hypothetical protein
VSVNKAFGYFGGICSGFHKFFIKTRIELIDFVDVAEEDMKFVQFKAGPLLPIIVIAGK